MKTPRSLVMHPTLRQALTTTLVVVSVATLVAVGFDALRPESPRVPTRVAIRVDCAIAADCTRAEELALDVWSEQRGPGLPLDLVLPDAGLEQLRASGVAFAILDPDIDATAQVEHARLLTAAQHPDAQADWFAEFHDYEAIVARLEQLAALAPERASLHALGSTLDGRTLWALRVAPLSGDAMPMLINGTQHAREWISAMSATCIGERLVKDVDGDARIKAFTDTTEAWIVPVVNPDGYQYSWGQDRYGRKNRHGGYGVDLNRNFAVGFGGQGSSGVRRSDTYRGEAPFSENESAALRALAKREEVRLHVDLHAYGQLVLYPWNHSPKRTDDHARLAAIGDDVAAAIYAQHSNPYRLMRGVELYPAAGTLSDWMYGEAGAISFTIELRPRSGTGFVLPPEEIRPTCDEALASVLALRGSRHVKGG